LSTPPSSETHRSRDELLQIVRSRAHVLRRRRLVAASSAMALSVLAVLGLVSLGIGPSRSVRVTTAAPTADLANSVDTATTGGPPPTSSPVVSVPPPAKPDASSTPRIPSGTQLPEKKRTTTSSQSVDTTTTVMVAPTSTTTSSTSTTTALTCYKSYDPRCGAFRWDPNPNVGSMTVKVTVLTPTPKAGQPVEFRVVVDEPDTAIDRACVPQTFGDGPESPCNELPRMCSPPSQATGAWPPPNKNPDHYETTLTHTYQTSGTYTASFSFWTAPPKCQSPDDKDPYRNHAAGTVTLKVGQ
jgi:hypothetical protein